MHLDTRDTKKGDWFCPNCNDLQFGRNMICRVCRTPNPTIQAVAAYAEQNASTSGEPSSKRARKDQNLERFSVDVPEQKEGVDQDFIRQLFDRYSTFPNHVRKETGCQCSLAEDDGDLSIEIEGDRASLPEAIARMQILFKARSATREALLTQFTNPSLANAPVPPKGRAGSAIIPMQFPPPPPPLQGPPPPPPSASKESNPKSKPIELPIPEEIALCLMTDEFKDIIIEQSGAEVEFDGLRCHVIMKGREAQVQIATKLVQRVLSHCKWGASESKVRRLLKPQQLQTVNIRLSPMSVLGNFEKRLDANEPSISIGKDESCDFRVMDAMVSRKHCILELDPIRGAVYIIDTSSNGTFLNGKALPPKSSGKVILSHGDDLVLKPENHDPNREFGWVVSITEMAIKEKVEMRVHRIRSIGDFAQPH